MSIAPQKNGPTKVAALSSLGSQSQTGKSNMQSNTTAAADAATEHPMAKVNRLAQELSWAMDDWMAEMSAPIRAQQGKEALPAYWVAHISPASANGYPIWFENKRGQA